MAIASIILLCVCVYQCHVTPLKIKEKAMTLMSETKNLEADVLASQRRYKQDSIRLSASMSRFLQVLSSKYAKAGFDSTAMLVTLPSDLTPQEEKWAERETAELKDLKTSVEQLSEKIVEEQKKMNKLQLETALLNDEANRSKIYKWLWFLGAIVFVVISIWGFLNWDRPIATSSNSEKGGKVNRKVKK